MALPRLVDGQYDGVAAFLNSAAQEIDNLATAALVRRKPDTTEFLAQPNVFYTVSWEQADLDTFGSMWNPIDPFSVRIRLNGVYTLSMQLRFPPNDGTPSTPPYYGTGTRSGYIMLNSQNPAVSRDPDHGTLTSDVKPWATDGEGVTLNMSTTAVLRDGHYVYGMFRHTATGPIQVLAPNFGGSYLSISRIGPLPPGF